MTDPTREALADVRAWQRERRALLDALEQATDFIRDQDAGDPGSKTGLASDEAMATYLASEHNGRRGTCDVCDAKNVPLWHATVHGIETWHCEICVQDSPRG